MQAKRLLAIATCLCCAALWAAADAARAQSGVEIGESSGQEQSGLGSEDEPGQDGVQPRIAPAAGHVPIGHGRQFRIAGPVAGWTLALIQMSAPDVATLGEDGQLTAVTGGWVIIGAVDAAQNVVAATDTIWLAGGPTAIGPHGGRAFAAEDTFVCVAFPPNASPRAMQALIQKRVLADLPAEARRQGTPVSVFAFEVTDAETGEDIGGTVGFRQAASLTLRYEHSELPPGVTEDELVVAYFDKLARRWYQVRPEMVFAVNTESNTITIGTTHASYWAIMPDDSVDEAPETEVQRASWGTLKHGAPRD